MKKIFKYPIEPREDVWNYELPAGAEIVAMRLMDVIDEVMVNPVNPHDPIEKLVKKYVTREKLFFWAIVDPDVKKTETRKLICLGTGWEIQPDIKEHIGTCITKSGLVWHLLEVK